MHRDRRDGSLLPAQRQVPRRAGAPALLHHRVDGVLEQAAQAIVELPAGGGRQMVGRGQRHRRRAGADPHTHNLAVLTGPFGIGDAMRLDWDALASRCLEAVIVLAGRLRRNPRPLRTVKDAAYAWRQMLFFLSRLPAAKHQTFAARAREALAGGEQTRRPGADGAGRRGPCHGGGRGELRPRRTSGSGATSARVEHPPALDARRPRPRSQVIEHLT